MTTSTLDRIDWATCLDDTPVCEDQDGCDNEATLRLFWSCKCPSELSCQRCWDDFREYVADELEYRDTFPCSGCDHIDRNVSSVLDVARAVPL